MTEIYLDRASLRVAPVLARFIEDEALPGTGLDPDSFWAGAARLYARFAPENAALLLKRDALQAKIDDWHLARRGRPINKAEYQAFLRDISYLVDEPAPFAIGTSNVDPEICRIAGPQLVVPVLNARFLLNAANARWGSLYDALYGTDVLGAPPARGGYDAVRGQAVIARAKQFLDEAVPLASARWADWPGGDPILADPAQLVARRGESLLLRNQGLHIEILVDRSHPIGKNDPAGIADIVLESALTTIVDFEDSVAAVDADDKVAAYANWLGLMRGNLRDTFDKNGERITRTLAADREWTAPDGSAITLSGRSVLFCRNVGHLMTTPAVLLSDGREAPEGILDGIVTSLIGLHDLRGSGNSRNSPAGSIYIVKPKMHGPEECSFADRLLDGIEDLLGLARHTIKIGVMDEERRTSANLAACIAAVRDRIAFINTGFLDRTGDEIHSSMQAGAMVRKADMRLSRWISAYEGRNVGIGLGCGLAGRAQIGKGMWAAPDRMRDMLEQKIAHPLAGATTAWVPSPTAATLHAMHYHQVDVAARQRELTAEPIAPLDALLTIPLADDAQWSAEQIRDELDNNAQGILGYVVRWIDQGIGCSKVPDIHDVALMEDRATLRIASQHVANWLLHGVCSPGDVEDSLRRMVLKVDAQNATDPAYRPMSDRDAFGLAAARALIFEGARQPNGYTEPLLHAFRKLAKTGPAVREVVDWPERSFAVRELPEERPAQHPAT